MTVVVKHSTVTGAPADSTALVDGVAWDANHVVTGLAAVASSGSAADLTGTLPAASVPTPTATTLGGIESITAASHKWINSISTSGVPTQTQPDATDITFTASGGTVRTAASRLSDTVSLLDFGADPTGVADSAPALRLAAAAVAYGGTIYVPAGSYLLNSYTGNAILDTNNLGFNNKGFKIQGVGWQLKVGGSYANPSGSIFKMGASIPTTIDFMYVAPTAQITGFAFKDFAITANGSVYGSAVGRYGIHFDCTGTTAGYIDFLNIDNIFVDNFARGQGLFVDGLSGGAAVISAIVQNSVFMTTKFNNLADNVIFYHNTYGANALTYVSAAAVAAGGSGGTNGTQTVTVSGGTGTAATLNVTVSGGAITAINSVTTSGAYAIFPTSPAAVTGAGLSGATVNLTQLFPNTGITFSSASGATSIAIVNCNFVNQDGGVTISGAQTPIIRDCEFEQNAGYNTSGTIVSVTSATAVVGAVISGCSISNNSTSGTIYPIFVGASQGAYISANTIYVPTGASHALVSGSAVNTHILYNTCYVNGSPVNNGTWSDSGTNTTIIENGFGVVPNYLTGLTLSTAGSSATFGIAAGYAADVTNAALMRLSSAYTKTTSAWALGTGNGGLDTGAVANSTWYHVYLISRPDTGVVDVLFSLSASAPTMPTSYTFKRRIGSMKTNGSAQWVKFIQNGDTFMWDAPVNDVTATNPGTSAVTRTVSTPLGVIVQGIFGIDGFGNTSASNPAAILLSDLAQSDVAPGDATGFSLQTFSSTSASLELGAVALVYTNTSSQVRSRIQQSVAAVTVLIVNTMGWIDTRGK